MLFSTIKVFFFLLLSKLILAVKDVVECEVQLLGVVYWNDSEVVALRWLKQKQKQWSVWVQNRVEVIRQHISLFTWHHVPTSVNLFDISTYSISLHKIGLLVHHFH